MSNKRGAYKPKPQPGGQRAKASGAQNTRQANAAPTSRPSIESTADATSRADAADIDGRASDSAAKSPSALSQDIKQEAKREARMQRQAIARAASEHRRRVQLLRRVGIIAVLVLVVVGGVAAFVWNEANKPGQSVAQMPSAHIADVTTPHADYNSDPPTSGPHVNRLTAWGVSATAVPKEEEVHNLEDGGVVISYNPSLDKAVVAQLENIARSYDTQVLMAPYPGLATPIALTAWGRIDKLNAIDEARIRRFIDAFRGKDHHVQSGS